MTAITTTHVRIEALARRDGRYASEASHFVFEALDYTVRMADGHDDPACGDSIVNQHVSGQQLLEGVRRLALDSFGCLALSVFRSWGIRQSGDFGEIVFNLVEHGLMGSQDSDSREDFCGGWGGRPIEDVFCVEPVFQYDAERDEWKATYASVVSGSRS